MTTTVDQRRSALANANVIRFSRAEKLRALSALPTHRGMLAAADLLEDLPPELDSMAVEKFLCRIRAVGPTRADGWLRRVGIEWFYRRLDSLTERQRRELATLLRGTRGCRRLERQRRELAEVRR